MGSVTRLKARHDSAIIDLDVATLDALALIQDQLKQALYGASDFLHLVAMDVSELERKRDDVYVQSSSGNSQLKGPRPNANPLRCEKDTTALDKLAASERSRQKELATAQGSKRPTSAPRPVRPGSPGKQGGGKFGGGGGGKPRVDTPERKKRADQSARDKADPNKPKACDKSSQPKNDRGKAKKDA